MKKRVLIFGYSGFVGPYLAKEFIKSGYEVFGSDVKEPLSRINEIKFFKVDILSSESVDKTISHIKPSIIINLAAISSVGLSWKFPQKTIDVNVVGAINILESSVSLKQHPKVLFIGSSEEYGQFDGVLKESCCLDATSPYGISKITLEMFAKLYKQRFGMHIFLARSFNHTGIGQADSFVLPSFCKQIASIEKSGQDGSICVGNIDISRDFSDVRDIVRAYRMIVESDKDDMVFNVGSGKAFSLRELLDYLISLTKYKVTVTQDSNLLRPSDIKTIKCDNHLILKEIGWKPEINIKHTLKEMFEYYLKEV